eukprot:Clim_evm4s78 gene=Clim_evmTU4s78
MPLPFSGYFEAAVAAAAIIQSLPKMIPQIPPEAEPEHLRAVKDFSFNSRRCTVWVRHAALATSQPLATQVGLDILRKGGNAVDASVAADAIKALTEPGSTSVGGDGFMILWDNKRKKLVALNGSGRSPKALTLKKAREMGHHEYRINYLDANCVTVPGVVALWCDAVEKYGSGNLTLAEILAPAIKYAEDGYVVSTLSSLTLVRAAEKLKRQSPNSAELLSTSGTRAPVPGEVKRNPEFARVLRDVANHGKAGFYGRESQTAKAIIEVLREKGGLMTFDDLENHTTTEVETVCVNYKGIELHEIPPNGQGLTALMALGILKHCDLGGKEGYDNVMRWHYCIEALRLAWADARYWIADPTKAEVPYKKLISDEYCAKRAALIQSDRAGADRQRGVPISSSDTVYHCSLDEHGNGCSFISSTYMGFGTGIVPRGCGFALQNRGNGFVLEEGHRNCLDGGKRPYHTIIPAMAIRRDSSGRSNDIDLYAVMGVMGGYMQPQGHIQTFINMVEHGMYPQDALDAPRFCIAADEDDNDVVYLEDSVPQHVANGLRELGHKILFKSKAQRVYFGRGQIIQKVAEGPRKDVAYACGTDPRGDGVALGY